MSVLPNPLPSSPRTTCGASSRAQLVALAVVTVFVTLMVLVGQPLTVAASIAAWLVTVTVPALGPGPNPTQTDGAERWC